MNEKKKEVKLCGRLIRPVVAGKAAIYVCGGQIHRTSRVVAIHEQTKDMVHFETQLAHYHLSMSPLPLAAVIPVPKQLTTCA